MFKDIIRGGIVGLVVGAIGLVVLMGGFEVDLSLATCVVSVVVVTLFAALIAENRALRHRVPELVLELGSSKLDVNNLWERIKLLEEQMLREANKHELLERFLDRLITPDTWQVLVDNYLTGFARTCARCSGTCEHYENDVFEVRGGFGARTLLEESQVARRALLDAVSDFEGECGVVRQYAIHFEYKMVGVKWEDYAPKPTEPKPEPVPEPSPAEERDIAQGLMTSTGAQPTDASDAVQTEGDGQPSDPQVQS